MRFASLAVVGLTACVTLGACSHHGSEEQDETAAGSALQTHADMGALRFRDIFATYLRADGRSQDEIQKLVYLPTDTVLDESVPMGASPEETLANLDRRMAGQRPSTQYAHGVNTPVEPIADVDAAFAASGPVTIVMIPGIFGEFIDNMPFQEVFNNDQSFATREWAEKSAAATGDDANDTMFSLDALDDVEHPMGELMKVASIDGADGKPLVRLVFPKPSTGSLETFGTLDKNSEVYVRRLSKYFHVMGGAPEKFYLLGYSRGTPVALDLAVRARAAAEAQDWSGHLAGVLTLGGVLYGSPLADVARDESQVSGRLIARLRRLGDEIEDCSADNAFVRTAKVTANTGRWLAAGTELGWIYRQTPSHQEIKWEGIDSSLPESGRFGEMLKHIIFRDALRLDHPASDYCGNVTRFKVLLHEVLAGVNTLLTGDRLQWWRTHTIPADMKLFAITGTMGDVSRSQNAVWPLTTNTTAYNPGSIDFKSLRQNYYDLYAAGGTELNDSQVPVSRGRFWVDLMRQQNPAQAAPQTYYLGLVGTHHWGFAFPEATATRNVGVNPFPRATLLKSLARFIAEAQARGAR